MFDKDKIIKQLNIQNNSQEEMYTDLFLPFIEEYLANQGFTLYTEADTAEVEEFSSFSFSQTIYYLPFWITKANLQKVEVIRHCSDSYEEITETGDTVSYRLGGKHNLKPRPYKELHLSENVKKVRITGIWGFGLKLPVGLSFPIFNILQEAINLYRKEFEKQNSGGKDLKALKIDQITYTYTDSTRSKVSITDLQSIFDQNQTFQKVLKKYV